MSTRNLSSYPKAETKHEMAPKRVQTMNDCGGDNQEMENVGRCPRCNRFLIAEEITVHNCDIEVRDVRTLIVDSCHELGQDGNGDRLTSALAIDGTYYRILECHHNPPHSLESRLVTAIKRPDNETEPLRRLW